MSCTRIAPTAADRHPNPTTPRLDTASVRNTTQLAQFLSSTLTLWGYPGDSRHDNARGWARTFKLGDDLGPCERPSELPEAAFLRAPVNCDAPLEFGVEVEPWNVPIGSVIDSVSFTGDPLRGCHRVPFDPSIEAAPTSKLAENATGLSFNLKMPNSGLLNPDAIAEGQPKRVEVTLPEGMTLNPSAAEGLAVCAPADYARERYNSRPGASKIGSVFVDTPLIKEQVKGALYQAKLYANPFGSLLAIYIVARVPERGILVELAGEVKPDPKTGQIVTVFDNAPPLPFDSFAMRLTRKDGEQNMTKFSSVLPPGVLGKLAGVGKCSEEQIAAAASKTGR